MPHMRERYLHPLLMKALKFSPVVGLLGQRQTGKTTLVSNVAKEYQTLDNRHSLEIALQDPEGFIRDKRAPFAIDECQLAPPLFPAIKEAVRLQARPGQYVLTGSVRFTSRKVIRESLTGRIFNLELLPLSPSESCQLPLSELPVALFKGKENGIFDYLKKRKAEKIDFELSDFLKTGGLPGICFHRDNFIRTGKFSTHLETLLERDLRLLVQTKLSFTSLSGLLTILARRQGLPLDLSEISRVSRISRPTVRQMIRAFESLFLIRTLPPLGGTARSLILFEDQGLATHLARTHLDRYLDLYRGLYAGVFPQFHYRPEWNSQAAHYLTRGGARVPLVMQCLQGEIGYVPEMEDAPSASAILSAKSFLKNFPNAQVVIAHAGQGINIIHPKIFSIPFSLCL